MESLREIVLFHQDEPLAEVWRRSEEGWPGIAEFIHGELVMGEPITVTGSVRLESIGLDLPFSEVFRKCDMRPRNKRRR
jgi:hypothetical protein